MAYLVNFNHQTTVDGMKIETNTRLPIERKELDTDNIVTLNTNDNTIKFNRLGCYKVSFIVSAKIINENEFNPNKDFITIGLRLVNTDSIYIGSSKWIYNGEYNTITGSGLLSINDINNNYELVNLSPKDIYLNTPDIIYIKSNSYFTNCLITMTIEYVRN